jgi:hypothetical protein
MGLAHFCKTSVVSREFLFELVKSAKVVDVLAVQQGAADDAREYGIVSCLLTTIRGG